MYHYCIDMYELLYVCELLLLIVYKIEVANNMAFVLLTIANNMQIAITNSIHAC